MAATRRTKAEPRPIPEVPFGIEDYWDYAFTCEPLPAPSFDMQFDPCTGCAGCEGWDRFCFNHH